MREYDVYISIYQNKIRQSAKKKRVKRLQEKVLYFLWIYIHVGECGGDIKDIFIQQYERMKMLER